MGTSGKIAIGLACLLAAAADAGLVRPAALDRAGQDLAAWQADAAAATSCRVASHEAAGAPDEQAVRLLERHCGTR